MKKLRANSYEAQLTPDELRDLYGALTGPGGTLLQAQKIAPPWRNGPLAGTKPSLGTLSKISSRLRAENRLLDLETTEKILRAAIQRLQKNPKCSTELMDELAQIVRQDYIQSFVNRDAPRDRIDLFRLLLKREQQRLAQGNPRHDLADLLTGFQQLSALKPKA